LRPIVIFSPASGNDSPVRPPPARMTRAAPLSMTSSISIGSISPVSPMR